MKIETVTSQFGDTVAFDKKVNKLLNQGWQIHGLTVVGSRGSEKYVAFMVKEDDD